MRLERVALTRAAWTWRVGAIKPTDERQWWDEEEHLEAVPWMFIRSLDDSISIVFNPDERDDEGAEITTPGEVLSVPSTMEQGT